HVFGVLLWDEDEKVIGQYAAGGACPYCGGRVQAMDVEKSWRLFYVPFYSRTKRRFLLLVL
ncbi:tRNA pseudouridine synthase Pus10, partial [Bienertia sinuspersici]